MSNLSSSNPPNLLCGIQIRRIWRKEDKDHLIPNILIFRQSLCLNKTNSFFVPRCVVQNKIGPFSVSNRIGLKEMAKRFNHRLIVEPRWFGDNQFTRLGNNISTVRHTLPAGSRLYFRPRPFDNPLTGYRGCYLKMHFILINNYRRAVRLNLFEFFYIPCAFVRFVCLCWEIFEAEPAKSLSCEAAFDIGERIT